jgi:antirestriction protein ArdC
MSDIYTRVTAQIIQSLEAGTRPWIKPWISSQTDSAISRPLRSNGEAYRGINILMLWSEAFTKGFTNPTWLTFKQALDLGGNVRKGERGSPVVYANQATVPDSDSSDSETSGKRISFLKHYTVFNVEQCGGLPSSYYPSAFQQIDESARIPRLEQFIEATGAIISHSGSSAFYTPSHDRIQMPPFTSFFDPYRYYGTVIHELIHWTGHTSRLDRSLDHNRYGSHAYATEELVAELGSAFVGADFGLPAELRDDHTAYLSAWLDVLKADKRAIFAAAAHAQRAADFLHGQAST